MKELDFEYHGKDLGLQAEQIRYGSTTVQLNDLPDPRPTNPARLEGASPMVERLWRIALDDVETNIIEQGGVTYFGAGEKFGAALYTRDIAFSGILALNHLYPDTIRRSLSFTREQRLNAGFQVPRGHAVQSIDAPWSDDLGIDAFLERFGRTHGITRRSDDVVWLWCAHDLALQGNQKDDWQWVYDYGKRCFDQIYDYFLDQEDGLYRGQAAFIDAHWPMRKATGYPESWSMEDTIMIKALSTNCLYVLGMEAMADAAANLGLDSSDWKARASRLRESIRQHLRGDDESFRYYKDRHGLLAEQRESLGTALLIPARVISREEAKEHVLNYPFTDFGTPLFIPFFEGEKLNHNNSSWPFVETFLLQSFEQTDGTDRRAFNAALMARTCLKGNFHEKVDFRNGEVFGSAHQLWTAAAFLNCCLR